MLLEWATCGRPSPSTESLMMHVMMNAEKMTMKKMSTGRCDRRRFPDFVNVEFAGVALDEPWLAADRDLDAAVELTAQL